MLRLLHACKLQISRPRRLARPCGAKVRGGEGEGSGDGGLDLVETAAARLPSVITSARIFSDEERQATVAAWTRELRARARPTGALSGIL